MSGAPPVVTVLIPVFNAAPWLDATLRSVRAQTFADLDILVIDDGSTDASAAIIAAHAAADPRFRVVSRENRGLVATLNEGLALARGRYVARMDADDLYAPDCIARQVAAMDARPGLVVLGVDTWERRGLRWLSRGVHGPAATRLSLAFFNAVGHPGVMLRRAVLAANDLHYDPAFFLAEDHDLWARLAEHGEVDILARPLLFYRRHDATLSHRHRAGQLAVQRRITARQLRRWMDVDVSDALALPDADWCRTVMTRLHDSAWWRAADRRARRTLLRLLQDFCLRHDAGAVFVRTWGWRAVPAGRWGGAWFALRAAARALRAWRARRAARGGGMP